MDKEIQKQLLDKSSDFINQAAQVLGATAQHVYDVLVRQQLVEGISTLVGIPLMILLCWIILKPFVVFGYKKTQEDSYSAWEMLTPLISIVGGLIIFGLTFWMMDGLAHIINPEYYAIKFIFEMAKGN